VAYFLLPLGLRLAVPGRFHGGLKWWIFGFPSWTTIYIR